MTVSSCDVSRVCDSGVFPTFGTLNKLFLIIIIIIIIILLLNISHSFHCFFEYKVIHPIINL